MSKQIIYHGTNWTTVEPNPAYNYNRCGSGLGFYWTNRREDASRYGTTIFYKSINLDTLVSERSAKFDKYAITRWLRTVEEFDSDLYLTTLSNFDEDINRAFRILHKNILEEETAIDQVLSFQGELMLRDTDKWCRLAAKLQLKGIEISKPYDGKADDSGLRHYVLYEGGC